MEICNHFREAEYLTYDRSKTYPEDCSEFPEYDPDLQEEFYNIINDSNVTEVDADFSPDVFDDRYLKIELSIPSDVYGPEFAKVKKRFSDKDRLPIGKAHNNPILDTIIYKV